MNYIIESGIFKITLDSFTVWHYNSCVVFEFKNFVHDLWNSMDMKYTYIYKKCTLNVWIFGQSASMKCMIMMKELIKDVVVTIE